MTCGKFLAGLLAVSLSGFTYAQAPAYAQTSEGSLYVFHSSANATCPALDWHIVVLPNNKLEGIIAWDGMKAIAHAVGEIGPNRNFTMHANEVGGQGRTATVTGTVKDGWLDANIEGQNVNCKGVQVQWWRPKGG